MPLFSRTTRKISLTEAGKALLIKTQSLMSELDLALDDLIQSQGAPSGLVRITLSRFAYQLLIRTRLKEFHQAYPEIELELSINDGTVNLVDEGFDLGIRFGDTINDGMVAKAIYPPSRMGLYASADYVKSHPLPTCPEELSTHRLITYRFTTSNRLSPLTLYKENKPVRVAIPNVMICNDTDVVYDAILAGIGIGRIFEALHQQKNTKDELIPVLQQYWKPFPALYLYYRQNSQRAKRVQAVINF